MTIGYVNPEYGCLRNIVGKCEDCRYVRVRSFKTIKERIISKFGLLPPGLQPYYFCGGIPESFCRIDLMHFWNNISLFPSKKPYITTYETTLPRKFSEGRMLRRGIESMLSQQCRKIIALSDHSRQRQMQFNKDNGCSELDKKICKLLPPQKILAGESDVMRKGNSGKLTPLRLIFVGKDFFRKGGAEIVRGMVAV